MESRTKLKERIKIFTALNHLGNAYEQVKLAKKYPIKWSYLRNNVRKWTPISPRPLPEEFLNENEFEWVTHYEPGKYDLAMLAVDQQHADGLIGKSQLYRQLNEYIQDVPKIVINHGTPMWDEVYTEDIVINGGTVMSSKGERHIDGIKKLIGDNFMIVNSYDAVDRWGWGYPLIHGMDPQEWWDMPKEPRVTVMISPGGLDKYYNRQLLTAIKGEVKRKSGLDVQHITVNYQCHDWNDYRQFLGRSLIYINPTLDSPMPRSRTEAMLSGCCVLTSRYHNADEFIEHGKEGFIMPDNPMSYAETVQQLLRYHYKEAVDIGQRGKEKAKEVFSPERYQADLFGIIEKVVNGEKPKWDGTKIWQ